MLTHASRQPPAWLIFDVRPAVLSTLRNYFRKRRVERLFGSYISAEKIERMVTESAARRNAGWHRKKLRVIVFLYPEWGFSDASLPRLRSILQDIEAPVDVSHNSLTVWLEGEDKKEFDRVHSLLRAAAAEADFSGFKIGIAEGDSESMIDNWRIAGEAFRNGRKA